MIVGAVVPALVAAHNPIGPKRVSLGVLNLIIAFSASTDSMVICEFAWFRNLRLESKPFPVTVNSVVAPGLTDRGVTEVIDCASVVPLQKQNSTVQDKMVQDKMVERIVGILVR